MPQQSKEDRAQKRKQQQEKQKNDVKEATQSSLEKLHNWAVERLVGTHGMDSDDAHRASNQLIFKTEEELMRWEKENLGCLVGFTNDYVATRADCNIEAILPNRSPDVTFETKKKREAKANAKEKQEQQVRDSIFKPAILTESNLNAVSGASSKSATPSLVSGMTGTTTASKKAKKKKLDMSSTAGVLVPGVRMKCECEARKHKLVGNCLNCGRIICQQEGSPCSFCGLPLTSSGQFERQLKEAGEQGSEEAAEAHKAFVLAMEHRNRLLQYEAGRERRTRVIDDQMDYFESTTNRWLTAEERAAAEDREYERQKAKEEAIKNAHGAYKIDLDLLSRGVTNVKDKYVSPAEKARLIQKQKMDAAKLGDLDLSTSSTQENEQSDSKDKEPTLEGVERTIPCSLMDMQDEMGYGQDDADVDPEYAGGHVFLSEQVADVMEVSTKVNQRRIQVHPSVVKKLPFLDEEQQAHAKEIIAASRKELKEKKAKEVVERKGGDGKSKRMQNDYWEEDEEYHQSLQKAKPSSKRPSASPWIYVNSPNARKYTDQEDQGMCLSMHQPWASLLVYGIKKHEGRSWETPFRGRLWIHAAAHQASEHDIELVENFYRGRGTTRFPTHYPRSVLLGCVHVEDCMSKEEYKAKMPQKDQESESEFVFVCSNPQLLVVPLSMDGQHKLFNLNKKMLNSAKTQACL